MLSHEMAVNLQWVGCTQIEPRYFLSNWANVIFTTEIRISVSCRRNKRGGSPYFELGFTAGSPLNSSQKH